MPRLAQPRTTQQDALQALAREFLKIQAERKREAQNHYGYFAKLAYDAGIPAQEIADTYGVTVRAVHGLIGRVK